MTNFPPIGSIRFLIGHKRPLVVVGFNGPSADQSSAAVMLWLGDDGTPYQSRIPLDALTDTRPGSTPPGQAASPER